MECDITAVSGEPGPGMSPWVVGDWVRHARHTTPCPVIHRQAIWGETVFRVWLPTKDAIIRARAFDLSPLSSLKGLPIRALFSSSRVVALQ